MSLITTRVTALAELGLIGACHGLRHPQIKDLQAAKGKLPYKTAAEVDGQIK